MGIPIGIPSKFSSKEEKLLEFILVNFLNREKANLYKSPFLKRLENQVFFDF